MAEAPPTSRDPLEKDRTVRRALSDGQRLEAYTEQQTREMRSCQFCERVGYRRLPLKPLGRRWVCIDCLRSLKELLEGLERWEVAAAGPAVPEGERPADPPR